MTLLTMMVGMQCRTFSGMVGKLCICMHACHVGSGREGGREGERESLIFDVTKI